MLSLGHILDGKYRVVDILGKGGMSTVYLCQNTRLENLWAIKEVPGNLKYQVDFLTEPNILKKLNHPGIPRIIDIFNENDNLYIVEDYIKGSTLDDIIKKEGPLKPERALNIGISICEILEYLHSLKPPIIYRDLKPSNVMIDDNGKTVLIDFGISRVYKKGQSEDTVFMGSKGYAAPEQFGNGQSGKQTDVYGLGATLFFMLLGRAPLNISEPLKNKSYSENMDINLRDIIKKSMLIEMEKRFEDASKLKEALNNVLIRNSSTRMLSNGNMPEVCEDNPASAQSIKEHNCEKTRFLNMSNIKVTPETIIEGEDAKTFDKTVLMDNKKEKITGRKGNKKKILGRYIAAILLILALLSVAKFILDMNSRKETKLSEIQKSPEVKVDDGKIKIENLNRDEIIEGVIYKESPTVSKTISESKSDEKEKGKGKDKRDGGEDDEGRISYLSYEVKPYAVVRKYNKNIVFKLEKVEVVNDILVTYLSIENKTDKTVSVVHQNNTVLKDSRGKSLNPYTSLSTDLSRISPGEIRKDIKIVFKGFSLNTDFISLSINIEIDEPQFTNRAVNLKVNVK